VTDAVRLQGGCHCGNLALDAELTRQPAEMQPRACDCSCGVWGALNVQALDADPGFAAPMPVSPQTLDADAKRERWRRLWFRDVQLVAGT
jgi:hypothetical protein